MTTFTTEQKYELIDYIFHLSKVTFMYGKLVGNAEVVRAAYGREDYERPQDFRAIQATAIECARKGQLAQNPRYLEAFKEGFSGDAAQKSNIGANTDIILGALVDRRLACTAENIRVLIGEWWDDLADNQQYTRQDAARKQREFRINEMTNNRTRGFAIRRADAFGSIVYDKDGKIHDAFAGSAQGAGASRGNDSPSFDKMSDEQVAELYAQFKTVNDYKNMSRDELRKVVKSNGATDIFGKDVHPDVAPEQDDRLHHPVTNEPFGQRSLIKYINEAPYNGRNLISRNGRVVPRLRQLFEQTIRGELG